MSGSSMDQLHGTLNAEDTNSAAAAPVPLTPTRGAEYFLSSDSVTAVAESVQRPFDASASIDQVGVLDDSLRHDDAGQVNDLVEVCAELPWEAEFHMWVTRVTDQVLPKYSENVLDDAFENTGCWTCSAALPEGGYLFPAMESPFAKRDWTMLPQCLAINALSKLLLESGVWAINSKGCKGKHDRTLGQDNLCISRLAFGWEVFCVFDGHGKDGHWPAARAAQSIASFLQQSACTGCLKEGEVEAALKQAFDAVQHDLEAESIKQGINLQNCGTSATVILRNRTNELREFVWVAVVGDSRAILFHPTKGLIAETTDHTPEVELEAARIEEMGGEIEIVEHDDGYISRRVNVKGEKFPGLGITRALGDNVVKKCGVISEPEIMKWSAKGNEGAYLLACSDGVWEFISSKRAVEFFASRDLAKTGPRVPLDALLQEAKDAWNANEGGSYTDDITMVLLPLAGSPLAGYEENIRMEQRRSNTAESPLSCLLS